MKKRLVMLGAVVMIGMGAVGAYATSVDTNNKLGNSTYTEHHNDEYHRSGGHHKSGDHHRDTNHKHGQHHISTNR